MFKTFHAASGGRIKCFTAFYYEFWTFLSRHFVLYYILNFCVLWVICCGIFPDVTVFSIFVSLLIKHPNWLKQGSEVVKSTVWGRCMLVVEFLNLWVGASVWVTWYADWRLWERKRLILKSFFKYQLPIGQKKWLLTFIKFITVQIPKKFNSSTL